MSDDPRDVIWRWRMDSAGKPTVEARLPVAGWCRVCWCDSEYIAEHIVKEHSAMMAAKSADEAAKRASK